MEKIVSSPTKIATKTSKTNPQRYPRYVFSIFFIISFLNYLDRNIFIGASNAIAKDLHLSLAQLGYIASAFLIVYTLTTIPLGLWADRGQRKNVVALSIAVWSFTTALTAFATSFAFAFFSRMLLGVGEAGYFPAGTALLSDYFPRQRRARIMSYWNVAQYVGIFVGFAVGGILAGMGLWREAFLLAAIPGALMAFLCWRIREPRRNQADEEADLARSALEPGMKEISTPVLAESHPQQRSQTFIQQCKQMLSIKTLLVLMVMQIFAFFVLAVNVTYLPIYLQQVDTFHLSQQFTGVYSGGIIILAGVTGNILGGFFSDLLQRRYAGARILICGISFLISAPLIVFTIEARNFVSFSILLFLTVAILAVYNGPSTAATQDIVPSWLRSSSIALSLFVAHLLGDAFAPALIGLLATSFDPTHGQHFANNLAGHELGFAILITCTPALIIAGLVGILGSRWMKSDVEAAIQAEQPT
jgi:MFS transporter, Spinster family, sphingosine-1-phosphate transporter